MDEELLIPGDDTEDDKSISPAEGERRATGGYFSQYQAGATLILQALKLKHLTSIRLADPDAGRVDDFQIITGSNRIDAYQVKWSRDGGNITFNDLLTSSKTHPSLFNQLSDGWQRIKAKNPSSKVVVHLLTNQIPSTSNLIELDTDSGIKKVSFSTFIEQLWKPIKSGLVKLDNIPTEWNLAWKKALVEIGLTDEQLSAFILDCDLDLGFDPGKYVPVDEKEAKTYLLDLESLTFKLFKTVASPSKTIEMTLNHLIKELGWESRFEFVSKHDFPVPAHYYPIKQSELKLEKAINELDGGYIALLGTPGAGKSTLLTELLSRSKHRVVKYYAFVPNARDPRQLRGESASFFHDITLAFENLGIKGSDAIIGTTREEGIKSFSKQLETLHKDWVNKAQKTVILIDGLDHVSRELQPVRSFLEDLPYPDEVPEGIFIILGTQTEQLPDLKNSIKISIRDPERRIEIDKLENKAILEIIEKYSLKVYPDTEQIDNIINLSHGNPLFLNYILKKISSCHSIEEIAKGLHGFASFNEVTDMYEAYWEVVKRTPDFNRYIGMLSRIRGPIRIPLLQKWTHRDLVWWLHENKHLFHVRGDSWEFFHNSFRVYLREKSIELPSGDIDKDFDKEIFLDLANKCSSESKPIKWDEIYYLANANENNRLCDLVNQGYFREQYHSLRSTEAIHLDILLALKAAAESRDLRKIAALILINSEINDRDTYLQKSKLVCQLIEMGEIGLADSYIESSSNKNLDDEDLLKISIVLEKHGHDKRAKEIFEKAEPHDLWTRTPRSFSGKPLDARKTLLEAWLSAATVFKNIEYCIEAISKLEENEDSESEMSEDLSIDKLAETSPGESMGKSESVKSPPKEQEYLIYFLKNLLFDQNRKGDLEKIYAAFPVSDTNGSKREIFFLCRCISKSIKNKNLDLAQSLFDKLLENLTNPIQSYDDTLRVMVAEFYFKINANLDMVREWLQDILQPDLVNYSRTKSGFSPFTMRFKLNRLLCVLGDNRSAVEIIPSVDDSSNQGMVYFERAICKISHLSALTWTGKEIDDTELKSTTTSIIELFNLTTERRRAWHSNYIAQEARPELYSLLIEAYQKQGKGALSFLAQEFVNAWARHLPGVWPTSIKRSILMDLFYYGELDKEWVVKNLMALEQNLAVGQDITGLVEELHNQIDSWIALGELENAKASLNKLLDSTFGVGYRKDYQTDTWAEWLQKINKIEPENALGRIEWFARCILKLDEVTEGKATNYAAEELVLGTFEWQPKLAISLFFWFIENNALWYKSSMCTVLNAALGKNSLVSDMVAEVLFSFILPLNIDEGRNILPKVIEDAKVFKDAFTFEKFLVKIQSLLELYIPANSRPLWRHKIATICADAGIETIEYSREDLLGPVSERKHSRRIYKYKSENQDEDNLPGFNDDNAFDSDRIKDRLEVKQQVISISDLLSLMESEKNYSSFDWLSVLSEKLTILSVENTFDLLHRFKGNHRFYESSYILLKHLVSLGESQKAWDWALERFLESESKGWIYAIDGGSRYYPAKALLEIDRQKAQKIILESLPKDLSKERWLSHHMALSLDNIIEMLSNDLETDTVNIWPEVEEYLRHLFMNYDEDNIFLKYSSSLEDVGKPDYYNALLELFAKHLVHPVDALRACAIQFFISLINQEENHKTATLDVLLGCIDTDDQYKESILIIFDALITSGSVIPKEVSDKLVLIAESMNYSLRLHAKEALSKINDLTYEATLAKKGMPDLYLLEFPSHVNNYGHLIGGERFVNYLQPFRHVVNAIVKILRISQENFVVHLERKFKELVNERQIGYDTEEKLRSILASTGLKLTFRRPSYYLAWITIVSCVSDLVDSGTYDKKTITEINKLFYYYDPHLYVLNPVKRPVYIDPISTAFDDYKIKEWVDGAEELDYSKEYIQGDWAILAEYSRLSFLKVYQPKEYRQRILSGFNKYESPQEDRPFFFKRSINLLAKDYRNTSFSLDTLIIQQEPYVYFNSPGKYWLALNPSVAKTFGWLPVEGTIFNWRNEDNTELVESVWWQDASLAQFNSAYTDVQKGEGWVVRASIKAWQKIIRLHENWFYEQRLQRTSFDRDEELLDCKVHEFTKIF